MKNKKLSCLKIIVVLSFFYHISYAQISSTLPTLIPPSPTVAALMKYEEIPVSNYTGIPNISIPLFSHKFPSNDIELNVGLSGLPQSIYMIDIETDIQKDGIKIIKN